MIYKAQSRVDMAKVTTTLDAVDIQRAKWAQQLTNKASSAPASQWLYSFTLIYVFSCFFSDYLTITFVWFLYSTSTQIWLQRRELILPKNLKLQTWATLEK